MPSCREVSFSPSLSLSSFTVHDRFAEGMVFSFNYNTLLLVASVLAGLGLVSNSSSTIIASMLVSPIMGPVVAMAYGTTIGDWKMVKRAIRTESLSLLFCVVVGFIIGAITGTTTLAESWPTDEMEVRGTWTNFLVALPVAFFSGLGVAVSLLDEQTSSLVGVSPSKSIPSSNKDSNLTLRAFLNFSYYLRSRSAQVCYPPRSMQAFFLSPALSLTRTLYLLNSPHGMDRPLAMELSLSQALVWRERMKG